MMVIFYVDNIFAAMTSTGGYEIWADDISVGGLSPSTSDSYSLMDTLGDIITGISTSTNYVSRQGFQELQRGVISIAISPSSINLGTLSSANAGSGSSYLTFFSNSGGSTVSFTGSTLSNGSASISAIGAVAASSAPGSGQFGYNVIHASGDAGAVSNAPYNDSSKYAFLSGDEIISVSSAMSTSSVFALNFIANIESSQAVGNYTAALTFTALGGF